MSSSMGKIIPYMKWKINMSETTNQIQRLNAFDTKEN